MKQILLLFTYLLVTFSTFGQDAVSSDSDSKFEIRFRQAKQDFVDNRFENVISYYDSIIDIRGNTTITTYKMAYDSYQNLILKFPENGDSLKIKSHDAYNEALKWYGKMFVSEKWDSIVIDPNIKNNFFTGIEEKTDYPGGMAAFYSYITENLSYPKEAKGMGIEGKVYVMFMVNKDGSVDAVNVVSGIGGGCDAEAVRVISNANNFIPGKKQGEPQFTRMIIPINFELTSTYSLKQKKRNKKRKKARN